MGNINEFVEMFSEAIDRNQLQLPDRFHKDGVSEKIWTKILPASYKLKEYVESLFQATGSAKIRKALKHANPGTVLSIFLGSFEHRQIIYHALNKDDPVAQELYLERHMQRLLNKLPDGFLEKPETVVPDEIRNLLPFVFHDTFSVLDCFFNEQRYKELSYDLKDLADFCLNIFLVRSSSYKFIVSYLDAAPWLKARQTSLYEAALAESIKEDDNPAHVFEHAVDIWGFMASHIEAQVKDLNSIDVKEVLEMDILFERFYKDHYYSPSALIASRIVYDQAKIKRTTKRFLSFVEKVDAVVRDSTATILKEKADNPALEINRFKLNDDSRGILGKYVKAINDVQSLRQEKSELLEKALVKRDELKSELSDIINSNNPQGMARIPEISGELQNVVAKINESAQVIADDILVHFEIIEEVFAQLQSNQTEKVTANETTAVPPIIAEELKTPAGVSELYSELNIARQQLEAARDHENELIALNDHLMDEIAELKKSRHEARKVMYEVSDVNAQEPSSAGIWLRKLLKDEGRLTPEEVLQAYCSMAPDRVVLLPSAIKSAREAENFELPHRLAQMLDSLIFAYLDNIRSGIPDSEARVVLGNRYAANESKTVGSNKRLRSLREFDYQGQTIFFRQHVGIGSGYGTQHALRIHFKVIDDKIVIAYCGEHMETMRSN